MKIAIPVDYNSIETNVCISFGRCPYFLIYDTETSKKTFLENKAAASPGGAGIKAAQIIVDAGVGALVTPRCGKNAADVLEPANIKIYASLNASAEDNINAFIDGKLSELGEIHPGFHNHGGK